MPRPYNLNGGRRPASPDGARTVRFTVPVTPAEAALIRALAAGRPVAEWMRDAALARVHPARVRELEAVLANERGEGEPPLEGWIAREDSDGPRWNREFVTGRGNHVDLCVWIDLELVDHRGIHPWAWAVMVAPDADSDMVEAACGTAPTAREAMRAAALAAVK